MAEQRPERTSKSVSSSPSNPAKTVPSSTTNPANETVLLYSGKRTMNKYVLACSLVASMNNILSGYGEFFSSSKKEKVGSVFLLVWA